MKKWDRDLLIETTRLYGTDDNDDKTHRQAHDNEADAKYMYLSRPLEDMKQTIWFTIGTNKWWQTYS